MSVRVYFDLPDGVYRQLLPVLDQNQETVNALGRRLMVDHAALVEASGISAVPMRGEPIPRPSRRINPERVQQPRRTADDQGNRHAPHLTREQIASIPVRFVDGGETVLQLADSLGVVPRTITYHLDQAGIDRAAVVAARAVAAARAGSLRARAS